MIEPQVGLEVRGRDLGKEGNRGHVLYVGVRCPDCKDGANLRFIEKAGAKGREEVRCSIHSCQRTARIQPLYNLTRHG